MPTTEGYNGAFTGAQIDEAIGQVRGKNLPADGVKFTDGETFQEKYDSGELTGPQGERGLQGIQGIQGPAGQDGAQGERGPQGPAGADGKDGTAATISVGTVTTGAPGSSASVVNAGTSNAAVLNFTIPRGADGAQGPQGEKGDKGDTGPQGDTGPAGANGADATINGVNALTLNATGGISGSQSGNTYTLDGSSLVQKTANLTGTDYTTIRARGIQLVTSSPGTLPNGCIAIVYS